MVPAQILAVATAAVPVGVAAGVFVGRWPASEVPAAPWVRACVAVAVPVAGVAGAVLGGASGALMLATLVPVVVIDLRSRLVPDVLVLPVIVVLLVIGAVTGPGPWWGAPLAAVAVGAMLMLPALVCPTGMGMGDAKLAVLLGAGLGITGGVAVLVALITGAVWGAVLAALHGRAALRQAIPLAPFLAVGALVALAGVPGAAAVPSPGRSAIHAARATGQIHCRGACTAVPARPAGADIGGRGPHGLPRALPGAAGLTIRPAPAGMLRHRWRLPTAQLASPTARPSPPSSRASLPDCRWFPTTSIRISRVASWDTAAVDA